MNTINFDKFEKKSIEIEKFDITERMAELNKSFKSAYTPENGYYGLTEVIKDTGITERTWRNNEGLLNRAYFSDEKIFRLHGKNSDGSWTVTDFDDSENAYLKKTVNFGNKTSTYTELLPNVEIKKGNFSSVVDELGRPISNKVTGIKINGNERKSLSSSLKDESYLEGDQRGHLIADIFGGTATKENIVPQSQNVNQSQFKTVENVVKGLVNEGHVVDYEVKVNYEGSSKRPSSFEFKITVDGIEYSELPDELKKIYNVEPDTVSSIKKASINVKENLGLYHENGMETGLTAAALTGVVSTVDNVSKFISGEISAEDMVLDIAKDTGVAGAIGYGTGFVSSAISQAMRGSSHALIQSAGKLGVPAAIISFGVESFDSVTAFASGDIDAGELAYDLGENAASVAGGAVGGMAMGAAVGSVIPGVGTVIGGILGGLAGTALASEAYNSIAETISEVKENGIGVLGDKAQKMATEQITNATKGMEVIGNKAQEMANGVVELVSKEMPDMVGNICSAINNFASEFKLPIAV